MGGVSRSGIRVFVERGEEVQSACIAGCTVVHSAVLSLQPLDEHRHILGFVATQVSSDTEMFFKRFLKLYVSVIHVSDTFEVSASEWFLVPLHVRVVGFIVTADKMDFVSRFSEDLWRTLMDFNPL